MKDRGKPEESPDAMKGWEKPKLQLSDCIVKYNLAGIADI